jgi:YegS/Rv2252/BmrU family lipid kinase
MVENQLVQTPQVFVVHNPVSGTSDPNRVRTVITEKLGQQGWKFHIYQTTGEENVRDLVKGALQEGYSMVWAAGGDGTVSGVANGLVHTDIPLGILPVGSGNALARELGIPLDTAAACDLYLGDHHIRRLDVLRVVEGYFVLSVSVGISALTMVQTGRSEKRRLGRLAYLLNGLRILSSSSLWPFQVLVDGQPGAVRASELIAANAGILGFRSIRWGSQVRPDDGEVNLCYAKADSLAGIVALLGGLLRNRQEQIDEMACQPARETIEIRSRRRMPVQGDGEPIGHTPVRIEVVSGSLSLMTPPLPG